jgi:hypothetical protein
MRLNIILGLLIVVFGILTCTNLKKATQTADVSAEAAATAGVKMPPTIRVPLDRLPPASASRRAYLSTGWWHMNEALQASGQQIYEFYRDKWLRFNEDQTFEIIKDKKVIEKGHWNWDENKNEIYLSCQDPWFNNTWQVKDKGFVMIWIGNTDMNSTGIQARVVNSKTEP